MTSFENSSMKSSFSLSSLRTTAAQNGGRREQLERPYHSLTKKRKEPCREAWRRSWGSAASGGSAGDDLWPLLQHHYDYIMDNQIIDTCKEANGELLSNTASFAPYLLNPTSGFNRQWSLNQLISEFSELCQWLTSIQEEIYSSPENLSNRKLRMTRMSELVTVEPRRIKFVEQASAILERIPEASTEVSWRTEHLNSKWEGVRLLLNPETQVREGDNDTVDTTHELRCLRRWLHGMEGRLPPPSVTAARAAPPHELSRKLAEHKVLQHDVECHGRIVSSVVRLCGGGETAKALERRWHLLYLRAIEWQCHLEACLARLEKQGGFVDELSDTDEEPALKQPRLCRRGSPRRALRPSPIHVRTCVLSPDSRESCSEEEPENVTVLSWSHSGSDSEACRSWYNMEDDRRVPNTDDDITPTNADQTVPGIDLADGPIDLHIDDTVTRDDKILNTPPTVIKRKKPINTSKFNQSDRKSKHLATFYFRHHDTDSDRRIETDEKSQEESSEEEWTYVGGKISNEDSTDIMTSSVEIQCELPLDGKESNKEPMLESSTPDLLRVETTRCKNLERLVIQAEELVQKQTQQQLAKQKTKGSRNFMPLMFEEEGKSVNRVKMSRIKEWLSHSGDDKNDDNQCTDDRYDASGEYTTESEVDASLTSEERNIHSSMDMSTSTCTVTPTHHAKVQLRKKRVGNSDRPRSVSCLSQLSGAGTSLVATPTDRNVAAIQQMSISESALNTLASPQRVSHSNSNGKFTGSNTTVQGHVSSTNTMTEACTSCVETNDKQIWLRRKRLKLRRRHNASQDIGSIRRDRLVKSYSFCGRFTPDIEDKHERNAASDSATSKKNHFDTTFEDFLKHQETIIQHLRMSIEQTHISTAIDKEIPEVDHVTPSFKLGPAGGLVRPRLARSMDRERTLLALSLGDPSQMYDLSMDKDSDVDRSINTAGTEEHSSFSEQAWDSYQEKYNSEPYSEAPDSDAARRLLEFGDDYRAYLDSQSDCCSSLSAQPECDSPGGARRRRPPSELSRERSLPRHKKPTRASPVETPARKPKKSMSSAERKKSLLDSLERSRNNTSMESNDGVRRRKPSESSGKNSKRSPEFDLLDIQELSRRRHSSNLTSDEINSSLEYTEVNNRPDILDSLHRRRRNTDSHRNGESELQKLALSELRRRSTEHVDSEDSSSPKKHSKRSKEWIGESDSDCDEVYTMIRRSSAQLEATEALMAKQESSPDLLRDFDYSDIVARCRVNINFLEAVLQGRLSLACQREVRAVSARWSALRAAASRRGGLRRLRRELTALRETLDDICEPGDVPPQPHTKALLNRRIDELKERLSRLLDCKVSLLKLTVSVRRALGDVEIDDSGLSTDVSALLTVWDSAHHCTSNELLSLEKTLSTWVEWETAFRELQDALRGDIATLNTLRDRSTTDCDDKELAQIKQLALSLIDKKKCGSTCDSLSDSGISDGDSEGAGSRARRLGALRELARRLQAVLAPNSPALKAIAKRMEQTENEVKNLQESCRALVEQNIPDLDDKSNKNVVIAGSKTGSGDPDYTPSKGWVWRVLRSSLPIQLCLVALLVAAWLVERPRCCDSLNSLAQTFTPQLRYVRGPPPM